MLRDVYQEISHAVAAVRVALTNFMGIKAQEVASVGEGHTAIIHTLVLLEAINTVGLYVANGGD